MSRLHVHEFAQVTREINQANAQLKKLSVLVVIVILDDTDTNSGWALFHVWTLFTVLWFYQTGLNRSVKLKVYTRHWSTCRGSYVKQALRNHINLISLEYHTRLTNAHSNHSKSAVFPTTLHLIQQSGHTTCTYMRICQKLYYITRKAFSYSSTFSHLYIYLLYIALNQY